MNPQVCSLDTSVFMDWQARYYPLDVFPSLGASMKRMVQEKECLAVDIVFEELEAVAPPDLVSWAKSQKGLFVPLSREIQERARRIESSYPDLMDPKREHLSADAYVIALAAVKNGIVVSQETSAQEKYKPKRSHFIPDVCRDLCIPCINFLGMMRREKWSF